MLSPVAEPLAVPRTSEMSLFFMEKRKSHGAAARVKASLRSRWASPFALSSILHGQQRLWRRFSLLAAGHRFVLLVSVLVSAPELARAGKWWAVAELLGLVFLSALSTYM